MAHLSSDRESLLAISIGNLLQIIDTSSNTTIIKHVNEASNEGESAEIDFTQHAFSMNKKYFAAVTGDKKLIVWIIGENEIHVSLELLKRPTCLCFCNKEDTVIVGDKSGDVYKYQLEDPNIKQQPILGHLSMVLCVGIVDDDSMIISADRDEKIRVSFYPNAYNIHSYCLGHTQLVSTITLFTNSLLISGSADKTLRLWDFKEGVEKDCIDISHKIKDSDIVISRVTFYENDIVLIGERSTYVLFFSFENNSLHYKSSHQLNHQPYDICFVSGKLFVLLRDTMKPLVTFQKKDGNYVESDICIIDVVNDKSFSAVTFPELKYLTNLIIPQSKKRSGLEITPEATISHESSPKIVRQENVGT